MIRFKHVSKTYETGNKAVRDLNLRIEDGEFVFIAGRSGSGKSTLIKLITGELKPTEGTVEVNGCDLNTIRNSEIPKYRRTLGVVFQDFRLLNDRNVYENIAFAQRVIGASKADIKKNVPRMLRLTGLSSKYKNMPNQLSGGEQQRVAIARALINQPRVILADEPTGNLDEANSREIMDMLEDINRMGTTVIVITHSRNLIETMHKRVVFMDKGVIVRDVPADGEAKGTIAGMESSRTAAQSEQMQRPGRSRRRTEPEIQGMPALPAAKKEVVPQSAVSSETEPQSRTFGETVPQGHTSLRRRRAPSHVYSGRTDTERAASAGITPENGSVPGMQNEPDIQNAQSLQETENGGGQE